MGVTINSVSTMRRQAGAEFVLLDSGAQLHACTASGAFQFDGGRLVTYKLREGRTIRVLFLRVCSSETNFVSLGCLEQQVYWSDLRADTGTLSFLKRPRRNAATHSCTMKRVCSLSNGCWLRVCRQLL